MESGQCSLCPDSDRYSVVNSACELFFDSIGSRICELGLVCGVYSVMHSMLVRIELNCLRYLYSLHVSAT